MTKKIDKRTKAYKESQKSKGLGDTIAKITKATGIKKVVEKIFGDDCGCDERQEWLNKLVPYSQGNYISCSEHDYLQSILPNLDNQLSGDEANRILDIYQRYVNKYQKHTNCIPCWKQMIQSMHNLCGDYERITKEIET